VDHIPRCTPTRAVQVTPWDEPPNNTWGNHIPHHRRQRATTVSHEKMYPKDTRNQPARTKCDGGGDNKSATHAPEDNENPTQPGRKNRSSSTILKSEDDSHQQPLKLTPLEETTPLEATKKT